MSAKSILVLFRDRSPVYRECFHKFVEAGRDYGYEAVALAPENTAFAPGEVDHYYFSPDCDNVPAVREQVSEICRRHDIRRIFISFEGDVYTGALCREDNDIEGLWPEHAVYFRDKNAMNARARELGVKVTDGCQPHTLGTLEEFGERMGYPLILKPYNGMACMRTYRVGSRDELARTWESIRNVRHDYRAERFIKGKEFHIDTLVQNGEVVFAVLSEYTHNLLDSLLNRYRSTEVAASITRALDLSPAHRQMLEYNRLVLLGFGLRCGVTHAEFYLTDDNEVYFGEVGARVGGGYIVPMIDKGFGVHLAGEWARMDLDPSHTPSAKFEREVGGASIITQKRGRIVSMSSAEDLLALDYVLDAQMWSSPGVVLRDQSSSAEALGYYVCAGSSFADVFDKLRKVNEHFRLEAEAIVA